MLQIKLKLFFKMPLNKIGGINRLKRRRSMQNKKFNTLIEKAFYATSSDTKLIEIMGQIWLKYDLNDQQTEIIEQIKNDAQFGRASTSKKYFIED
jgi:hypothetical protein